MNSKNKTRVKTNRRLKEWELHPFFFSNWKRYFHFEKYETVFGMLKPLLQITGLYKRGYRNASNPHINLVEFNLPDLPPAFEGLRILFVSDLHIDGNPVLADKFIELIKNVPTDLVILGGDYRFKIKGTQQNVINLISKMVSSLDAGMGIFGVLGNHDSWEMLECLEQTGIRFLVNESVSISRQGQRIWLSGVDDAHYFRGDDLNKTLQNVPLQEFKILISHSNDILNRHGFPEFDLVLCGHTHGGQINFPLIGPLLVHSKLPRKFAAGAWTYKNIPGFTTRGLGTSGLPVRFNCPPEIVLIKLNGIIEQSRGKYQK